MVRRRRRCRFTEIICNWWVSQCSISVDFNEVNQNIDFHWWFHHCLWTFTFFLSFHFQNKAKCTKKTNYKRCATFWFENHKKSEISAISSDTVDWFVYDTPWRTCFIRIVYTSIDIKPNSIDTLSADHSLLEFFVCTLNLLVHSFALDSFFSLCLYFGFILVWFCCLGHSGVLVNAFCLSFFLFFLYFIVVACFFVVVCVCSSLL